VLLLLLNGLILLSFESNLQQDCDKLVKGWCFPWLHIENVALLELLCGVRYQACICVSYECRESLFSPKLRESHESWSSDCAAVGSELFCFHFPLLAICSRTVMSLSTFSAFLGFLLRMLHSWNCFMVYAG
jgi:hypothetical protein